MNDQWNLERIYRDFSDPAFEADQAAPAAAASPPGPAPGPVGEIVRPARLRPALEIGRSASVAVRRVQDSVAGAAPSAAAGIPR